MTSQTQLSLYLKKHYSWTSTHADMIIIIYCITQTFDLLEQKRHEQCVLRVFCITQQTTHDTITLQTLILSHSVTYNAVAKIKEWQYSWFDLHYNLVYDY